MKSENENLERLVKQLRDDSHEEEAKALLAVYHLMTAYATTDKMMDKEAELFGAGLRKLAKEWATVRTTSNEKAER